MADRARNYVSMGRNPNWQLTCGFPQCGHWKRGDGAGGWCQHPQNRVPPQPGWPNGFTPSTISTGGCDLHTASTSSPSESGESAAPKVEAGEVEAAKGDERGA